MKPTFALNFTDTSIVLLHRTAKGWMQVGETPFDTPDLDDAVGYLRNTALGLEPTGFTTKLVIPNSQLLYAEITAPGPSEAERRAQIVAALESRTGLKPDEMAFDWSGKGDTVKVVAVDRQTLAEAESFASTHRFDPVGFVAIPAPGAFDGEPFLGPAGAARDLAPNAQAKLRDKVAITILPTGRKHAAARPEPQAEPAPAPAPPPPRPAAPVADTVADTAPAAESPRMSPPPAPERPAFDPAPSAAVQAPPAPEPRPEPRPEPPPAPAQAFEPRRAPEPAPAPQPAPAFQAPPQPPAPRPSPFAPPPAAAPAAEPAPAPVARAAEPPSPAPQATPMTPPPFGASAPAGEAGRPASVLDDTEDDLPPMPSPAALVAFASRRGPETGDAPPRAPSLAASGRPDAATLARAAHGKPVEDLPPMPRPPQAGAARPLQAPAGRGGGLLRSPGALVTAPSIPGTRKVKAKPQTATAVPTATAASADAARSLGSGPFAARSARRGKPRHLGLILTVILLLCLALVAGWSSFYLTSREVEPTTEVATADPAADTPDVADEMLADGEDPEALADAAAAPEATEPADAAVDAALDAATDEPSVGEPAPDTGAAAEAPASVALVDQQDEIFLAGAEAPPPALDPLALPPVEAAADAAPPPPMPPPAFGTVYKFDANGLLLPTPDGILSPAGVMLYEGKPPRVPPARSPEAEAAAARARDAAAAAPAAEAEAPAMVEALPVGAAPAPTATAEPPPPAAQPDPDLADRRPKLRPEGLVPASGADDALLQADPVVQVTSLRPRERPQVILAAGERARSETASASLASAAPVADGNGSVLAISRRPASKPDDFSGAVEAAVAAAVRLPVPKADPEPEAKSAAPDLKPEEQDEADEPEVASAAPKIPTKASVAKQATFRNALNLSKTNLIGVYGTQSKRYALVRLSTGKYKKVRVGDRIDGGTVKAITQTEVRYQKGGRLVTLKMPKG